MISNPTVVLDTRDYRQIYAQLLARRPGYVNEWLAPDKSAGSALGAIAARYVGALLQRLNQAPDKNKLAFFDLLGLSLDPAQAARAPLVFQLSDGTADGNAPAGTAVSAPAPPGSSQQIVFETETAAGIMAGKIVQVFSLWPGRDEYIDHSADLLAGNPIEPFSMDQLQTAPHIIYMAHSMVLALAGNVELGLEFELTHGSAQQLEIAWEYWDGKVWRGFLSLTKSCQDPASPNLDSTLGLTGSGNITLLADCTAAQPAAVNGSTAYWLRGRLTEPLPQDPLNTLPEVESIKLSSTVNQVLTPTFSLSAPYAPPSVAPAGTGTLLFAQVSPQLAAKFVSQPASQSVPVATNLGGFVNNQAGQPVQGAVVTISNPDDPSFGQVSSPLTDLTGTYSFESVPLGVSYQFRVTYGGMDFIPANGSGRPKNPPTPAQSQMDITLAIDGLKLDQAFSDGVKLDVSKPFYPLGQQPQPGSAFYLTNAELLSKPGAKARMYVSRTHSPQDESSITGGTSAAPLPPTPLAHLGFWEYWNGRLWAPLPVTSNLKTSQFDLNVTEILDFTVPVDMEAVAVNNQTALWVRFRLASGSYGFSQTVSWQAGSGPTNSFKYVVAAPPVLNDLRLGYTWQFGPFHPEQVLCFNDFQYQDHTYEATWPGQTFQPFIRMKDVTPALYLGIDKQPPADDIGIYFDIVENPDDTQGPALTWEYWDGGTWSGLVVDDGTSYLRLPGILSFLSEPDSASLARFGTPLFWVRGRLKDDGDPGSPTVNGIYPNAVWASQLRTDNDLVLGTSTGTPNQAFLITNVPVLDGERIEIQELSGPRANVEWRILALQILGGDTAALENLETQLGQEGLQTDIVDGDLRLVRDRKKRVTEVWVHWQSKPWLYFSGPDDRDYAIDRAQGSLLFGDGVTGAIPPAGASVLVKQMQSGGGAAGNVAARIVTQLQGVVAGVQGVFNPRAAEGGADGETTAAAIDRCPKTVRHRGRAIAAADYETLAFEASPAVAVARSIPGRNTLGRQVPGWITLMIIPHSLEERPYPSFGLRQDVVAYIAARAPADIAEAGRINVVGPDYFPIDVAATVAPNTDSQAGSVEKAAQTALATFLHPLLGGPGGNGWDLGRSVFLSDIAAVLENVEGLDFVEELSLGLNGVPQGDSIAVPARSIVVAGTITLRLTAAAR